MPREARITTTLPNDGVRLEPDDRLRMIELAKANERSLAAEIRVAVKFYLRASERTMAQ